MWQIAFLQIKRPKFVGGLVPHLYSLLLRLSSFDFKISIWRKRRKETIITHKLWLQTARRTKTTRTNNWKREIEIDGILFDLYGNIYLLLFRLAKQISLKIYIHRTWTHINLHVSFMFSPLITLYILSLSFCSCWLYKSNCSIFVQIANNGVFNGAQRMPRYIHKSMCVSVCE